MQNAMILSSLKSDFFEIPRSAVMVRQGGSGDSFFVAARKLLPCPEPAVGIPALPIGRKFRHTGHTERAPSQHCGIIDLFPHPVVRTFACMEAFAYPTFPSGKRAR